MTDLCDGRPEYEYGGEAREYTTEISSLDNKTMEFRVVQYIVYFFGKLGYTTDDSFRTMWHVFTAGEVRTTFYIMHM